MIELVKRARRGPDKVLSATHYLSRWLIPDTNITTRARIHFDTDDAISRYVVEIEGDDLTKLRDWLIKHTE